MDAASATATAMVPLTGAALLALTIRHQVRTARSKPQSSSGAMVLRRKKAPGVFFAAFGCLFGLMLVVGPRDQGDWIYVVKIGMGFLFCAFMSIYLIAEVVVVRMTDGHIVRLPLFGRGQRVHVSSLVRAAPFTERTNYRNSTRSGLRFYGVDGQPLLELGGKWRGIDHFLRWLNAVQPGFVMW